MGAKSSKNKINEDLEKIGENEVNISSKKPEIKKISTLNFSNNFIFKKNYTDLEKDYQIIKSLKKDINSEISIVQNKLTDVKCLMKTIYKVKTFSQKEEDIFNNELKLLSALDHPNITKIMAVYSKENLYSYITEYCKEGSLNDQLLNKGQYDEKTSAYIMYQIFSALNYCHINDIINRDLSIENILISDIKGNLPTVKISYFGNSIFIENDNNEIKNLPKAFYYPPEINRANKKFIDKSDIWSCGVIMYFLLTARPPFIGSDENEKKINIINENFNISDPPFDTISRECKDLLKLLLKSDPKKRPSAEEVLNHPWFTKTGVDTLIHRFNKEDTLERLLNNIKNYINVTIFKRFTIIYLIHNFPQITDVKNSAKLFYMIDTNHDGKIAKEELLNGLNNNLSNKISDLEFDKLFKNIDLNNNGFIDYEEFVAAAVNKNYFLRENILTQAFKFFDKDNSGEISFDEIEKLFKDIITDDKIDVRQGLKKIMEQIDLNIDGKINFDEFCVFMKQLIE